MFPLGNSVKHMLVKDDGSEVDHHERHHHATTLAAEAERKRKAMLFRVLVTFFLYSLAFTFVVPAFPTLLLRIAGGDNEVASSTYGAANCMRYLLEFFSSPFLGNVSDSYGRKRVLLLSLAVMAVEFLALAMFPSIPMLFAVSCLSGLGNSAMAMGYAIVTDLAELDGPLTNNLGYFSAVFGLGFILGPPCGSYLISVSLPLCFLVAGVLCVVALLFTWLTLDEKCVAMRPFDSRKSNPLTALKVFFSNADLRQLAVPYCASNLCTGIYFVWVMYMGNRFHATIVQVGLFLSASGVCGVLVQGVAVPFLIPAVVTDEQATLLGLALSSLQLLAYGFSPALWVFYLVLVLLSPASMYGPALKAMLARTAGPDEQGALQGALGSLRTVTAGLGSLLFSVMFSLSIAIERPKIAGLPFFVASAFYMFSFLYTRSYIVTHRWAAGDGRSKITGNLLSGSGGAAMQAVSPALFGGGGGGGGIGDGGGGGRGVAGSGEESLNLLGGVSSAPSVAVAGGAGGAVSATAVAPPPMYAFGSEATADQSLYVALGADEEASQ